MSYRLDSREEKIEFIYETMTGFYSVMRNLQEDYKTYSQNYSKQALELLSKSTDFINAVEAVRTLDSIRRINDEGIDELTKLSRTISQLYHLRVQIRKKENPAAKIKEEKYYFEAGIFYLDARRTGITVSDIFPEIFLETSWNKDRKFYTDICRECLGITDPNFVNGEYKVNLKFDGNDDTEKDNKFGVLMRKKYITDRFIENGEAGVESGRKLLIEFDSKHGTKICKSENDYYNICERIYKELIPSKTLIPPLLKLLGADILMIIISFSSKDIILAMMMLTILYALLEPYIKELEKKLSRQKLNCKTVFRIGLNILRNSILKK